MYFDFSNKKVELCKWSSIEKCCQYILYFHSSVPIFLIFFKKRDSWHWLSYTSGIFNTVSIIIFLRVRGLEVSVCVCRTWRFHFSFSVHGLPLILNIILPFVKTFMICDFCQRSFGRIKTFSNLFYVLVYMYSSFLHFKLNLNFHFVLSTMG